MTTLAAKIPLSRIQTPSATSAARHTCQSDVYLARGVQHSGRLTAALCRKNARLRPLLACTALLASLLFSSPGELCAEVLWARIEPRVPVAGDSLTVSVVLGKAPRNHEPSVTVDTVIYGKSHSIGTHPVAAIDVRYTLTVADTTAPSGPDSVGYGFSFTTIPLECGFHLVRVTNSWDTLALFRIDTAGAASGIRVSGTVVDAADTSRPVPGVGVTISYPDVVTVDQLAKGAADPQYRTCAHALTDSLGCYAIHGLPAGILRFKFHHPNRFPRTYQLDVRGDKMLNTSLYSRDSPGSVVGEVRISECAGDPDCTPVPLEGAEVVALVACGSDSMPMRSFNISPWYSPRTDQYCVAYSDSAGHFELHDLDISENYEKPVALQVTAPGVVAETHYILLRPGPAIVQNVLMHRNYPLCASRRHGSLEFRFCTMETTYVWPAVARAEYTVRNTGQEDTILTFYARCNPEILPHMLFGAESERHGTLRHERRSTELCVPEADTVVIAAGATVTRGPEEIRIFIYDRLPWEPVVLGAWIHEHEAISKVVLPVMFLDSAVTARSLRHTDCASLTWRFRCGKLSLFLPRSQTICLTLFNLQGREVATILPARALEAGAHTFRIAAPGRASGPHVLRVTGDGSERALLLLP